MSTWTRTDIVDNNGAYRAFGFRNDGAAFYAEGVSREQAAENLDKFLNAPYDRNEAIRELLTQ